MRLVGYIEFDDNERETILRAMQGHGHVLVDPPRKRGEVEYLPVRNFINKLLHSDGRYDMESLQELRTTLNRLIDIWHPQTRATYWQALVSSPLLDGDEPTQAMSGLARERRCAIDRANDALDYVREAQEWLVAMREGVPA